MSLRDYFKYSAWGRIILIPYRFTLALGSIRKPLVEAVRWTFRSRELYNFTYDLNPLNRQYLASYIAVISGHETSLIQDYIHELEQDEALLAGRQDVGAAVGEILGGEDVGDAADVTRRGVGGLVGGSKGYSEAAVAVQTIGEE